MALKSSLLLSLGICKRSPTTTGYLNSIWDSQAFSLCLLPGAFQYIFCLEHALCHLPATSASWVAALPRCPSVYSSNTVALRLPGSRPLASLKVLSNGCAYSHALDLRARARAGRQQGAGRAGQGPGMLGPGDLLGVRNALPGGARKWADLCLHLSSASQTSPSALFLQAWAKFPQTEWCSEHPREK